MRFKVPKHLSESAEDIGVVKAMLKDCDTAGNVLVREIFPRIGTRLKAVTAEQNLGFEYMNRSSSSSCFVGMSGLLEKTQMQRPASL